MDMGGETRFFQSTIPPLEDYVEVVRRVTKRKEAVEEVEWMEALTKRLEGMKILEINSTAIGGGVAEMLYSSVPFLNQLGIRDEWRVMQGNEAFFKVTKTLHNFLQGKYRERDELDPEMQGIYYATLLENVKANIMDSQPDVVVVHDPQPMGLAHFLKRGEIWLWRCHIDIEETYLNRYPILREFLSFWIRDYEASIFSAVHYIISQWSLPKFIIPPFIDPFSIKNRELQPEEVNQVLEKYQIDPKIPIVLQVGRFDPWKGLLDAIHIFRKVREEEVCQLILAGGAAADDPEGEAVLERVQEEAADDPDIHIINLPISDIKQNHFEVNALQRAASVILQLSFKEGFGLTITECMWKQKPVIATPVGGIPLQIRDGLTGFLVNSPTEAEKVLLSLLRDLRNPTRRGNVEKLGRRARRYVGEHFLMPQRVGDYLEAINLLLNAKKKNKWLSPRTIISYHPWFKLRKRREHSFNTFWKSWVGS